jgi:high-affinity iron transporter
LVAGLVLSLREGLEAALILGIVLGTLHKIGQDAHKRALWIGVGAAIAVSLGVGLGLTLMGSRLEGISEEIFEGTAMFLAAGVLTWAIFWMRSQGDRRRQAFETGMEYAVRQGRWGIAVLAFIAVVREGIELSLFLTASALSAGISNTMPGAIVGILLAVGLGWGTYHRLIKLNMRTFFQITGAVLIVFAAGLIGHGIHEFIDAGWIPGLISPLWNLDPFLPESSGLGQILTALFGYQSSPSLAELLGYLTYIVVIAFAVVQKSVPGLPTADGSLP